MLWPRKLRNTYLRQFALVIIIWIVWHNVDNIGRLDQRLARSDFQPVKWERSNFESILKKRARWSSNDVSYSSWNDSSMSRYQHINLKCRTQTSEQKLATSPHVSTLGDVMMSVEVWDWIFSRINHLWSDWQRSRDELEQEESLVQISSLARKRIFIIPGVLSASPYAKKEWLEAGGPRGELLQWADIIAALHVLGHNVTVEHDMRRANSRLQELLSTDIDVCENEFDLIYTDILGLQDLSVEVKSGFRCRFRVLDCFGTQAMYNDREYSLAHHYSSPYGGENLHLKQFYTFYPHTPDNSFLGFVVTPKASTFKKENIAVLYGKEIRYAQKWESIIKIISKFMSVHYTTAEPLFHDNTDGNFVNHGVLSSEEYPHLLDRAKVFLGLGDPVEGTGVMEALAHGCVFINPKFTGTSQNILVDNRKPTTRKLTSQVPYLENYIGLPCVATLDMDNITEVVSNIKLILQRKEFPPYIPREFTMEGYLARLALYVEHQGFCDVHMPYWPPISALETVIGREGQSCEEACDDRDMICEPTFFEYINKKSTFQLFGFNCSFLHSYQDLLFPAAIQFQQTTRCVLQERGALFSCASEADDTYRICPCRNFLKYHVALCEQCVQKQQPDPA